MSAKKAKNSRTIFMLVAFAVVLLFRFLPAPAGMSQSAMQVIGIFIGVLTLWLTVAIDWPSILVLGLLAFVPELNMNGLLASSFGNSTFAFLMFTFLCTYALSQTPFIRRCAIGFITSSIARRGPWIFTISFFASIMFIGAFISPTVLFVIYLPIIEEIYDVLRLQKGNKSASMLMIGLVVCCGLSCGMTPIAHVFPIMAMNFYKTATGNAISAASYMALGIPVGIICFLLMLAVFRFVMRPDVSNMETKNVSELKQDTPKMETKEIMILSIFTVVVLLWVLPGIMKPFFPNIAGYIDGFGTAMPPLIGVVVMCIVTYEGKPLMNFSEAMSKGVPWGSLVMSAGTLALGSAISNPDIGLTTFLSEKISPFAQSLAPIAMVALFTLWAAVQTNLSSNMVTVTVVTAIAIPICLATNGAVNTAAVCAIIGLMASYAFAFPPAMPCVAIAGASGWTNARSLAIYGSLIAFISVVVTVAVGYPIASALMVF